MRNTKPSNAANAAVPCQMPWWKVTDMAYDSRSAGNMEKKTTRRAGLRPNMRTVKSVARKINGKLNAPQVECTS